MFVVAPRMTHFYRPFAVSVSKSADIIQSSATKPPSFISGRSIFSQLIQVGKQESGRRDSSLFAGI